MKSKLLVCTALAAALTMSVVFSSGCATRNEEDMNQVIATVDITKSENLESEGLSAYSSAISSEKNILKRDLMASFYNVGYSYVQNGSTYSEVFNMLVDALTSTAVVTQYATLSLIKDKSADNSSFLDEYISKTTEVEKYEYLLEGETSTNDDGSEGYSRILAARYSLYSSINSSIDSLEQSILDEEDDSSSSDETRSTPGGASEEKEDYIPLNADGTLDYGIYTGYEGDGYSYLIEDSGAYEDDMLEGSTRTTRRRAYASFVTNLRDNFLISDDDVRDVLSVSYIQDEYLSQLQQQVINEYYERYQAAQEALIENVEDGVYTFLAARYQSDFTDQQQSNSTYTAFETSMSSLSDTSFILYAPSTDGTDGGTYGYVYNILLPFDAAQNVNIDTSDTSAEYYFMRKDILDDITTTDQRAAWFNGQTDYSFDANEAGHDYYGKDSGRNYLFFEDNLTRTDRYQSLDKYDGRYSYNGAVTENADGSYSLSANKLDINQMLDEFTNYVNYVLGTTDSVTITHNDRYDVEKAEDYYELDEDGNADESKIDYSRFVYASGKVDLGYDFANDNTALSSYLTNLFNKDSAAYKALSAVNELQYAYTTDTSVLSQYVGYSVSAFETSYVPEFEYAAQAAVNEGPGSVYVCAADYGWHIIYVTATFPTDGSPVYGDNVQWTEEYVLKEGTFQNLYYNWVKDSTLTDITTNRRSIINQIFGGDATITKYEDTYSDLLALDEE